jgi:CO/xanthine dehydrogenase Mo-binding subunit
MSLTETRPFLRHDGVEKVTGEGRYTADLALQGMLHGAFLVAGRPFARIRSLDTSAARALSGVFAVLTHEDVPDVLYGGMVADRRLFARDLVRFEGEIVAAVAARTEEIAREACALVRVEYEDLEPVLDLEAALAGPPLVHPEWESYGALDGTVRNGNDCGYADIRKGDVDAAFAEADLVVESRFVADMSHPVAIEPHAVVAHWQGDKVTVWSSTQVPFAARSGVATCLQIPESRVRVIVPHLGGGFGGKCEFHFEAHVAALARAARRPVRLVLDRREEFIAIDMARHAVVTEVATAVKRDGTMLGRRCRLLLDTGAYATHGPACSDIGTMMAAGPYRIPNLDIRAHALYTNRTPAGSTRAPTGPQICWAIEQHTDEIAEALGIDPLEVRLRNVAVAGDEGPTGQVFDAIGVKECVEEAARLAGWGEPLPEGEGVGLACGWWFSFPTASDAAVRVNTDGTVTIVTGAQENGSGAVSALRLLAADELGIAPEEIQILAQDTDAGTWDMGSCGSQTTFNNGRAVVAASAAVAERLVELAAELLEASPQDLELAGGSVRAKDAPGRSVTIAEVASHARDEHGELIVRHASPPPPPLPDNFGSSCLGRTSFPAFAAPAFFCHAARVAVDRETGVVRVLDLAAAHDFGRVLNPPGAIGQVEGGALHGLGMALTEGTVYAGGGLQHNPHLLDYKLQTAADAPEVRIAFVDAPDENGGPRGSKGVGEPPVVPTAGAVGNAIARATGARVRELPMTPVRVWAATRGNGGSDA